MRGGRVGERGGGTRRSIRFVGVVEAEEEVEEVEKEVVYRQSDLYVNGTRKKEGKQQHGWTQLSKVQEAALQC